MSILKSSKKNVTADEPVEIDPVELARENVGSVLGSINRIVATLDSAAQTFALRQDENQATIAALQAENVALETERQQAASVVAQLDILLHGGGTRTPQVDSHWDSLPGETITVGEPDTEPTVVSDPVVAELFEEKADQPEVGEVTAVAEAETPGPLRKAVKVQGNNTQDKVKLPTDDSKESQK